MRAAIRRVLVWFAVLAQLASASSALASTPVPVDAQIRVTFSGLVLNRATNTFDTVATIANIGSTPVFAPMTLTVTGISIGTVHLANATGTTAAGQSYLSLLSAGSLNAGATLAPVVLKFSNPSRVGFSFTQSISGVLAASNHAPSANAGADQTVEVGATVTLDGTQSTDVDGDRLTYRWSLVSAPNGSHAALAGATSVNPSFVADLAGNYAVRLIASDGLGDSVPATVVVSTVNSRPVANAGRDQLVASGSTVRLDGTHSTDVDGDALIYHWTLASRPSGSHAALDAATAVAPAFVADKAGAYQVQLVVNDGHVDSTPANLTVSTQGVAPIANAGPDQAVSKSAHVQLDGGGSQAASGAALTYRWALVTVPAGSSAALVASATANPTFVVDLGGVYTAQLIVNDGHLDSAPGIVVISTGNVRPVADAGVNQSAQAGQAVTLDGTLSRDANGNALGYSWSLLFKPANSTAALAGVNQAHASLTCDVPGTFVAQLIVSDGEIDSAPATSTVTVAVAPPNHDPQITSAPPTTGQTGVAYRYQVVATDQDGDTLAYALTIFPTGMSIGAGGLVTWTPGTAGTFAVTVRITDGHGGSTTQSFNVMVADSGLPPDPSAVAPRLDPGGANSFFASTGFLYSGPSPIQTGVARGTIDLKRVSVLRGKIADSSGAPLTGVTVTIVGHPEFGQTLSRVDGMFDMAANGGGRLTLRYVKTGFLPAQRQVPTSWQDFTIVPDVALLPRDSRVTTIHFGTGLSTMQVARANVKTDVDGSRQATVLFPAGTTAALVQPNGSTLPASTLNVRFTEYTVGPNGPKAMPGDLPPTSTYTYAVELGADEAVAKVDGRDVVFNQPVIYYVENFMHVPVGQIVPVGYYDPARSAWIGAPNGRVIKILGITQGMADIDGDGDGIADGANALAALGVTNAERQQLAALYVPGTTLWRTPMDHFSTNDQNWSFICIPSDCGPPAETPPPPSPPCQTTRKGSIIGCERQTLGEDIDIAGTPFKLHYESDRVPGRTAEQGQLLSLASHGIPNGVKAIQVEILVAGQKLTQTVPTSTGATSFAWDGNDAYGRALNGTFPVTIRVGYTYDIVATAGIVVPSSWARFTGIPLSVNGWRTQITLYQETTTQITRQDQRGLGFGGWSMSVLHAYDPRGKALNLGNGMLDKIDLLTANVMQTVAGDGSVTFAGDGVSALKSGVSPAGITVAADGSVYIVDGTAHRVIRVDANGVQAAIAGTGVRGFSGDGGAANQAQLANPTSVALGTDGSVYISDRSNFRVRRVAPNGVISTYVGTGIMGVPTEGAIANATPIFPRNVAVGPDGRVFISDAKRIWVVDQNGVINAYAGADALFGGDGGPALQAGLQSPNGMAFTADGTLFFVDNDRIRKVTPQGIISTVAGPGNGAFNGDGGPALSAGLDGPRDVTVGADGSIYIAATNRVRRVGTDGVISTFAGNGAAAPFADGGPGPQSAIATANALATGPDGTIYVADAGHHRVRRIAPALPGISAADVLVPSGDGREVYDFSGEGRHVRTLNALTGATLLQFTYDANGYLVAITDGDQKVTSIERNGATPMAIVAPGGQRTVLSTDANGWLSRVTNPASESRAMSYTPAGLLQQLTDARGNAYRFTYDSLGRLVKDEDPAGGFTTLARTDQPNGYSVLTTSSLGRTQTYLVETLGNGSNRRTLTDPAGLTTVMLEAADGSAQTTDPAGVVTAVQFGPDPRWGMVAPLATSSTVTLPSGLKRTLTMSRVATLTDPANPFSLSSLNDTIIDNGRASTSNYDATARRFTNNSAGGRATRVDIDALGRVTRSQLGTLAPVSYAYVDGELRTLTRGTQAPRTTTLSYNAARLQTGVTDPLNRVVGTAYDGADRVVTKTLADGRVAHLAYDANGNLASVTPPGRSAHAFSYSPVDQQTQFDPPNIGAATADQVNTSYDTDRLWLQTAFPDGRSATASYDGAGRLAGVAFSRGSLAFGYTPGGMPDTLAAPSSVNLAATFDGNLMLSQSTSGPIPTAVSSTYDSNFRIASQSVNGGSVVASSYDPDGLPASVGAMALTYDANNLQTSTRLGTVSDTSAYNPYAELLDFRLKVGSADAYRAQFTRDALGRVTQKIETIQGVADTYGYSYDLGGRLVGVTRNGMSSAAYTYDANSNRASYAGPFGNIPAAQVTVDAQDRLLIYGGNHYAYNSFGQLTSKSNASGTTSYTYDEFGNLTHVALPGGTAIDYVIDGLNRRIGKRVNGTLVRRWVWDAKVRVVAELDGSGNLLSRFVYATHVNVPDYVVQGASTYRLVTDPLGSPRLLINSTTGAVAGSMNHDEYGRVTQDSLSSLVPFGFAGGLYDAATGLVRFGARDYDAEAGRWTAKDPKRFAGNYTNLYGYASQDPVDLLDPYGMDVSVCWSSVVGGEPMSPVTSHWWLETDTLKRGMGNNQFGDTRVEWDDQQSKYDTFTSPGEIQCKQFPNADESCVNSSTSGDLGRWLPWNTCHDSVNSVLKKCAKNPSSPPHFTDAVDVLVKILTYTIGIPGAY